MRLHWSFASFWQIWGLASDETVEEEFPYRFYVSDLAEKFKDFANSILPYNVEKTQKIDIEKY